MIQYSWKETIIMISGLALCDVADDALIENKWNEI